LSMKNIISLLIRYVPRRYLQQISGNAFKIIGWFYRGNKVFCPVCETSYRKFMPYGRLSTRANALCPNCLSLERHRLIWLYLYKKTDFFVQPLQVLHVAPEVCFINRFEAIHGHGYVTADIESPLAKVKMDIHHIPFSDNMFDVILCNHVLEHVDDDIKAMREIRRVLKPGGFAILQVPFFRPVPEKTFEDPTITDPKEREKIFGQNDHVRKYGQDYPKRIEQSGLEAIEEKFTLELTDADLQKFGLAKSEVIYIGAKP
jgi:SAM-dependent methyltransferase